MRRYRPGTEPDPMTDRPSAPSTSPALSDEDLRETLELFSTVLASVSDRVDDQTHALDRINKTATEARQAAFAAREQTDPERSADIAVRLMNDRIAKITKQTGDVTDDLIRAANHTGRVLTEAETDRKQAHQDLWMRERKLERVRSRLPWFCLGAAVLVLALSVALPRFIASYPATCAAIGSVWTTTSANTDVCAFYRN